MTVHKVQGASVELGKSIESYFNDIFVASQADIVGCNIPEKFFG